jgi:hypothetical protein
MLCVLQECGLCPCLHALMPAHTHACTHLRDVPVCVTEGADLVMVLDQGCALTTQPARHSTTQHSTALAHAVLALQDQPKTHCATVHALLYSIVAACAFLQLHDCVEQAQLAMHCSMHGKTLYALEPEGAECLPGVSTVVLYHN